MSDGAIFAAVILFVIGVWLVSMGAVIWASPCDRRDAAVARVMIGAGAVLVAPPLLKLWLLVVLS